MTREERSAPTATRRGGRNASRAAAAASRGSSIRRRRAAVVLALATASLAMVLGLRLLPRTVTSVNGQPLGRLAAGTNVARLNLLLVTLDTTRADRGLHVRAGFDGIETPNLDRLARRRRVVRNRPSRLHH